MTDTMKQGTQMMEMPEWAQLVHRSGVCHGNAESLRDAAKQISAIIDNAVQPLLDMTSKLQNKKALSDIGARGSVLHKALSDLAATMNNAADAALRNENDLLLHADFTKKSFDVRLVKDNALAVSRMADMISGGLSDK